MSIQLSLSPANHESAYKTNTDTSTVDQTFLLSKQLVCVSLKTNKKLSYSLFKMFLNIRYSVLLAILLIVSVEAQYRRRRQRTRTYAPAAVSSGTYAEESYVSIQPILPQHFMSSV